LTEVAGSSVFLSDGESWERGLDERRERIVEWVEREILPHEASLRRWLGRMVPSDGVEDLVQDIYCKLAGLEEVAHIRNPRAYLFQAARSLIRDQIRRSRIVKFEAVADMGSMDFVLDEPSPERTVAGRRELATVVELIACLPERARRIVELRKIEGLPQREIARLMGVTETIVENDVSRGMRFILKALADGKGHEASPQMRIDSDVRRARDR